MKICINKRWYIYIQTMEYYSALKRKKILQYATTQMNLEDVMLVKQASHINTNTVWFHLCEVLRVVQTTVTERSVVIARGWRMGGMGSYYLMGLKLEFYKMKSSGNGRWWPCATIWTYLTALKRTLINGYDGKMYKSISPQ